MRMLKWVWLPAVLAAVLGMLGGCGQQGGGGQDQPPQAVDTPAVAKIATLRHRLKTPQANDVMVVAHRACWREAPENSLAAIAACIEMGADMVEIDVHVTADNHLVIMHDDTVDRTTNGTGMVNDLTLAQIKELFLKEELGGPNAGLTQHRVPTLEEALTAIRGNILVNLDAKGQTLMQSLVVARQMNMTGHILFKAANPAPEDVAQFNGTFFMPVIRDSDGSIESHLPAYKAINPVAVEVVYQDAAYFEANADTVTQAGYRLWVNTMWEGLAAQYTDAAAMTDPDAYWGFLVSRGVNMIQTDEPKALLDYLRGHNLRQN